MRVMALLYMQKTFKGRMVLDTQHSPFKQEQAYTQITTSVLNYQLMYCHIRLKGDVPCVHDAKA